MFLTSHGLNIALKHKKHKLVVLILSNTFHLNAHQPIEHNVTYMYNINKHKIISIALI